MIQEFKKIWKPCAIGLIWFLALLWPMLGIHKGGFTFHNTFLVWGIVTVAVFIIVVIFAMHKAGQLKVVTQPVVNFRDAAAERFEKLPTWTWIVSLLVVALVLPHFSSRYICDVSIQVLVYICLGLGLNIVVGLAGMLDLGYIAFYGVGAYTYALLNVHYGVSFWLCLPISAALASIASAIIGYPTLRMRGDYLAIVTLGFGEIVRIVLNNWMDLTNGPNGILNISVPQILGISSKGGLHFHLIALHKLQYLYYVILALAVFTIMAVHRLNFSRVGRAWESIREDETAAELMGVNTFMLKLLAYVMGAVFAGLAGAFFAARYQFVSPESFTFMESAMVLSMVVLGGMGSLPGVILGSAALIILPEMFRQFALYRMLAFGASMTLMVVVRPEGLIPAKRMGHRSEEQEG